MAGLILHLHPQTADVHVHNLDVAEVVFTPDTFEDALAHQRHTGVAEEQLHDLELHLSQLDGLARLEQDAAVLVQHEAAAHQ